MKKVMIVVGASDGLGKSIVKHFCKKYQIVAISKTEEKIAKLSKEFGVAYKVCDIARFNEVENCIKEIFEEYGRIDVLVNSAGVLVQGELEENDYEKIEQVFNVNLNGLVYATKAVLKIMKKQKDGVIFNIDSICTDFFRAERSVYYASKWGVDGFTKCMQQEVGKYGIKIVNVRPGTLATNMFKKIGENRDLSKCLNPDEVSKLIEYMLNLPKDVFIPEVVIKNINN